MEITRKLFFAALVVLLALRADAQVPDTLLHSIPAPVRLQSGAHLGTSVAVDGAYAIAGAPTDDFLGIDSGVVKVFDTTSGALLHVLPNPSPESNDRFGSSVALSGTHVVVSAYRDSTGVPQAGSAYVFDLSSATPTVPVITLNNPYPAIFDQFGIAVGISGTHVVVGAPEDDFPGSAYVFDLNSSTPTIPVAVLNSSDPGTVTEFGASVAISGMTVVVGAPGDFGGEIRSGRVYVFDLASGTPTTPLVILASPVPTYFGNFGGSVAIAGTRVVVGETGSDTGAEDAGSAYVFDLGSQNPTAPITILNNPAPAWLEYYGGAVAICGSKAVIGAFWDDSGVSRAGVAYVYDLTSGVPSVPWSALNNPTPVFEDYFGYSVAISDTKVVVGAYYDDTAETDAGSAYVYDFTSGVPTAPAFTLNNPGLVTGDGFAHAVSVSGSRIAMGMPYNDTGITDSGSVSIHDLNSATPTMPVATLNNPGPGWGDLFGYSVGISGTRVVVGAYLDDTGATNAGSAYVFDLASGTPTVPVVTLNNPIPSSSDWFGYSVAISGTRVVVGASMDDTVGTNAGSVYVYDLSSGTPTVPIATLNNPSPGGNDVFGSSVAISGLRVIIGAYLDDTGATNAGSAYIYDLSSGTPTVPSVILNNPFPAVDDRFGISVGISDTRVVVGSRQDDTGANDAGSAYVYDIGSGTPNVPVATLNNPDPQATDWFGYSVAISGIRAVVGAYADDAGLVDAGSAYVYDLSSFSPEVPVMTLNNPSSVMNDQFGYSVAIDGTTIAIGAPFDDTTALDEGSAYIFVPSVQSWRQQYFGSIANSGDGADLNDYDKDGILNIAEFGFGLNPKQNSAGQLPQGSMMGGDFVSSFIQPAGVTGITFGAEWNTMLTGPWTPITDSGIPPQHIFSVPIGAETKMFMRLKVTGQ